jgi:hypothetical protein
MTANTILNKQVTVSNERADGYNVAPANVMRKEYDADMTNQRFTFENEDLKFGIKDNGKYISVADCVNLLNELNNENKQLKFQLKECREHKLFSRRQIEQENKELQQKVKEAHKYEKQKLTHNLKIAIRTERTELGRSVLNQLLDQMEYY